MEKSVAVTISATVNVPIEKVWKLWNTPEDIVQWNTASPDWHTPTAKNDLKENGKLTFRMEAKDGSFGFDFEGTYTKVIPNELIEYTIADGRKVRIQFTSNGNETHIVETFDAETENPVEMQRDGWQAILNSFKAYSEKK